MTGGFALQEESMLETPKLIYELNKASKIYAELRSCFHGFFHLASQEARVKDLYFEPELENNFFDVRFAGNCIRFRFVVFRDDEGYHGQVYCLHLNPLTKGYIQDIGSFNFECNGKTNLRSPGSGERISINNERNSPYILFTFLFDSFDAAKQLI
jgi:hypothetical protein